MRPGKGPEDAALPGKETVGEWDDMPADSQAQREQQVLETAMEAGHILLENGAEISRVEETMERITRHFGVDSGDFFVLSNGIFTTGGSASGRFARVEHIPVHGAQMDRVVAVNQLSREVEAGKLTLEETAARLKEIRRSPGKRFGVQVLASAVGSAAFCVLFGGSLRDAQAAFIAGLLLYLYVLRLSAPHLSKLVGSMGGGALVSLVCVLLRTAGMGDSLSHMIIGSIIPLVPGVAFVNGIRDIADGDYISGAVRMLDALLVFFGVAIGVGFVLTVSSRQGGGAWL